MIAMPFMSSEYVRYVLCLYLLNFVACSYTHWGAYRAKPTTVYLQDCGWY